MYYYIVEDKNNMNKKTPFLKLSFFLIQISERSKWTLTCKLSYFIFFYGRLIIQLYFKSKTTSEIWKSRSKWGAMALLSSLFKKLNALKRLLYHVFFVVPLQTKSLSYAQTFLFSLTSSYHSNIECCFLIFLPRTVCIFWFEGLIRLALSVNVTVWPMTLEKIKFKKFNFLLRVKVTNPVLVRIVMESLNMSLSLGLRATFECDELYLF